MAWTGPAGYPADGSGQGYPPCPGQPGYGQPAYGQPGAYPGYPGYPGYGWQQAYPVVPAYPGYPAAAYPYPGYPVPGDPWGLGKPSNWPTFLVTFFFGIFGLIPAIRHATMARERGYSQASYWVTFGLTMALPALSWIFLFLAFFAIAGGTAAGGGG